MVKLLEYNPFTAELEVTVVIDGDEQWYIFSGISGWGEYWDYHRGDAFIWNQFYESIQRFLDREVPSRDELLEMLNS